MSPEGENLRTVLKNACNGRRLSLLCRRPDRDLPERVSVWVAGAGDHLVPPPFHFGSGDARVFDDRAVVSVAPGLPDSGKHFAGHTHSVDDDGSGADVSH